MKLLQRTNRSYIIISASAFTVAGLVTYFILSTFFESQLNEKLADSKAHLVNAIGRSGVVYNDPPYIEVKEVGDSTGIRDSYSDTLLYDSDEDEKVPFRQLKTKASISGKSYSIILRNTLIEKSDFLITIIITTVTVFLLLLLCMYFINRKLSRKLWSPFYSTLSELKAFSQENTSFLLATETGIDEFEELRNTLNKLTTKVISDYQVLKRFTEDASHEIQTPLSIIQSRLESLIQSPDLSESQANQIQAAYSASTRLSKLTRSMLLLARIENRQFPEKEKIDLGSIITKQIESLDERINAKKLEIIIHSSAEYFLDANIFLAESLVQNIVGNAVKYSFEESKIEISIGERSLEVKNIGAKLQGTTDSLFERFTKADNSSDSFGLGLSIVREICKVCNWNISYSCENNLHIVRVVF
jgi:signal transduction histidine kinase